MTLYGIHDMSWADWKIDFIEQDIVIQTLALFTYSSETHRDYRLTDNSVSASDSTHKAFLSGTRREKDGLR